jgi:hypothetical protein
MSNKLLDIDLVLKSRVKNIDVLCFTEHWIKEDYLTSIQLDQYKLVSHFGRRKYNPGGSCVQGVPRVKVTTSGVFLMLNYTDITQKPISKVERLLR